MNSSLWGRHFFFQANFFDHFSLPERIETDSAQRPEISRPLMNKMNRIIQIGSGLIIWPRARIMRSIATPLLLPRFPHFLQKFPEFTISFRRNLHQSIDLNVKYNFGIWYIVIGPSIWPQHSPNADGRERPLRLSAPRFC
jgi:hypothetical protein